MLAAFQNVAGYTQRQSPIQYPELGDCFYPN